MIIIICFILILIGLLGILLPSLPGIPFIFASLLIYAIKTGFSEISITLLIILAILSTITQILDYFLAVYSSKYWGATKYGIWGGIIGLIIGILFSPFGLISIFIMPSIGAIIGEIIGGKKLLESTKIGIGNLIGVFIALTLKMILAGYMIFIFIRAL